MERTYFPAGTMLGGFVVKTFLTHTRLGSTYLADAPDGKKYFLSILNDQPERLMEQDISVWKSSVMSGISTDIQFLREPVPAIFNVCHKALTIEECAMAGITLTLQEAVDLLHQTVLLRKDLIYRGAEDAFFSPSSVLLTPEKELIIQRDHLYFSNFDTVCKKLTDLFFSLAEPEPGISLEKVKKYCLQNPEQEFSVADPMFKEKYHISPEAKIFRKKVLLITAAILAACTFLLLFAHILRNVQFSRPEVKEQKLSINHRSSGPVIHAGKSDVKQTEPLKNKPFIIKPLPPEPAKKRLDQQSSHKAIPKKSPDKIRKVSRQQKKKPVSKPHADELSVARAAKQGNLLLLKSMIDRKADVNKPDASGKTAMYYAASSDWNQMIHLLHQAGAKITDNDINAAKSAAVRNYLKQLAGRSRRPVSRPAPKRAVQPKTAAFPESNWVRPHGRWYITLEQAMNRARVGRRKIVVLFTGSDWSPSCLALRNQVLFTREFHILTSQAELLYIDFPQRKNMPPRQRNYNRQLRRRLDPSGKQYPCTVILNYQGKVLDKIHGFRNKKNYLSKLKRDLQ